MPRLDPEYSNRSGTTTARQMRRHRLPRVARPVHHESEEVSAHPVEAEAAGPRREGLGGVLWPAAATFAMVFAAGLYLFWLRHPGEQPAVAASPHGFVLPSFALVAGWVAGLALLPRLLPRPLAWPLLAAGTVFVAVVLSREVTAWLQAVIGSVAI